jgi:hypothetical protein
MCCRVEGGVFNRVGTYNAIHRFANGNILRLIFPLFRMFLLFSILTLQIKYYFKPQIILHYHPEFVLYAFKILTSKYKNEIFTDKNYLFTEFLFSGPNSGYTFEA